LALRAFEQGGIFIVPHLLWPGKSVFPVSSDGPPFSRLLRHAWGCGGSNPDPHWELYCENFHRIEQRLYFLYPWSLCTHAELPIFLHWLQIQRCVLYFWDKLGWVFFSLRGSIKFLGSGLSKI
jgi:hypothetical protein